MIFGPAGGLSLLPAPRLQVGRPPERGHERHRGRHDQGRDEGPGRLPRRARLGRGWTRPRRPTRRRWRARANAAGMCTSCHMEGYLGASTAPRLAGQQQTYLELTLHQFKTKERANNPGDVGDRRDLPRRRPRGHRGLSRQPVAGRSAQRRQARRASCPTRGRRRSCRRGPAGRVRPRPRAASRPTAWWPCSAAIISAVRPRSSASSTRAPRSSSSSTTATASASATSSGWPAAHIRAVRSCP